MERFILLAEYFGGLILFVGIMSLVGYLLKLNNYQENQDKNKKIKT
jgi:hypothetical protein